MADLANKAGGKAIVFARPFSKQAAMVGTKVAYQTTYGYKLSRDSKSEDTKDGKISKGGSLDGTLSMEMLASNQDLLNDIEDTVVKGNSMEFWIVYTDTPGSFTNKYAARYMVADITSHEETGDSDNSVSLKLEATIKDGYARRGEVTLSLDEANSGYKFKDLGNVTSSESSTSASQPNTK
jgi:TP901-1 family phage major tail protein